nr:hypothetical chloroplast RF41 [Schizostauron trachyderma]
MNDTNYIGTVVRLLETPNQKMLQNKIIVTKFRAQIPQLRNTRLITVTVWGNLARDVAMYYKINDYLLIEGYISLRYKKNSKLTFYKSSKVQITALKVYPFLLNYDSSIQNI